MGPREVELELKRSFRDIFVLLREIFGMSGGCVRKVREFGSERQSRAGVKRSFWDTFCASKEEIFGMKTSGWEGM